MNRVIHIVSILQFGLPILFIGECYSQDRQTVTGFISDAETGSPIAGARINAGSVIVTVSNSTGRFELQTDSFLPTLGFSHSGYSSATVHLLAMSDTVLRVILTRQSYRLNEITVTATRPTQLASESSSSISVVLRDAIDRSNSTSLADLVSPVAGLFVKNYGGTSGLKTISQRGMGTEHTLVLVNGMRVNSVQNGLTDLGLMTADFIESVEVLRGGQSASYGADAVAGVVNVVTRPPADNHIAASSSVGSFGYRRYHISGGVGGQEGGLRAGYGEERSNEDFPFAYGNGEFVQLLTRRNADMIARYGSIQGSVSLPNQTHLTGFISMYASERGVGGAVVSPASSSRARQTDRAHMLQLGLSSGNKEHLRFLTNGQVRYSFQRYVDPDMNVAGESLDNSFENLDIRVEPRVDLRMNSSVRVGTGIELGRTLARGNSLRLDAERTIAGPYTVGEVRLMNDVGCVSDVILYPAMRFDAVSSAGTSWSPQAGARVSFKTFEAGILSRINTGVRASLSRNFRAPTFNELYYAGGGGLGNPDLRPERATSFDAGADLLFAALGDHYVQASYFRIDMKDRVVWVAAGAGIVSPRNMHRIRSEGFEFSHTSSMLSDIITIETNYTLAETRNISPGDLNEGNQLIYIPRETFNITLALGKEFATGFFRKISVMARETFTGYRYISEDNADFLPSFKLTDIAVAGRMSINQLSMAIKAEINNLFDEDYQVIIGYPMPRRSFRLTVGVQY